MPPLHLPSQVQYGPGDYGVVGRAIFAKTYEKRLGEDEVWREEVTGGAGEAVEVCTEGAVEIEGEGSGVSTMEGVAGMEREAAVACTAEEGVEEVEGPPAGVRTEGATEVEGEAAEGASADGEDFVGEAGEGARAEVDGGGEGEGEAVCIDDDALVAMAEPWAISTEETTEETGGFLSHSPFSLCP